MKSESNEEKQEENDAVQGNAPHSEIPDSTLENSDGHHDNTNPTHMRSSDE